ncbi:hypothetical protein FXE12_08310 [Lactobacillus sp. SL9-6]|nr:hypothetical protein FXE12_08310 [Lactobacillus sp. SL9-6]
MENKKIHYKMYKSGKFIMYSAIFSLTMGLGLGITTSAEASTVSIQPTAASSVTDSAQSTAASSVADSAQSTAASSVADSAQSTAASSVADSAQSTAASSVADSAQSTATSSVTDSAQSTATSSVTDGAQSTATSSVIDSAQSTAASSVTDSAQSTATSSVVDGAQSTATSNVNIKSPATTTVTPSSNNYVTPTKEQLDQLKAQIEKSTDNFNTSFGSQLPTGVKIDELKVDNNTHKIIISASTSAPNINSKDNMYTTYAIAAQIMMAPDITKTVFDMSLNKFQVEMVITNTNMQNQQISMTINGSYTMAVTVSGKTVDGQSLYSQVDTKNMYAGDSWSSTPAEIDGYHVVTSLLPENASGTANILATQEIIYVYAPDTTPGDNGGTTPGDNGGTTPGDNGGTTPGDNGGTTPGDNGGTTPGDNGGTTPGDNGGTTPGDNGGMTPGDNGGTTPGDNGGMTPGDNEQLARLWYNTPYSVEKNTQTHSSKKDTTQLPQTDDNKKNSENLTTIGALLVFVVGVIHFTLKKRVI